MPRKTWLILLLILLLAFGLRIYKLSANTLYGDELTIVADTYSILKTGKDTTGESWPLTFSLGAGRPGGYIYASLPLVALFGPTVLGVRGLSLLSGLGVIILLYFLGKKLFNEKVGLWASFVAAVSPWELALSRAGFEAHWALFLALLGLVSFLFATEKPRLYLLSALSFGLAIHTYPTYKLTLILILGLLIWYQGGLRKILKKATSQKAQKELIMAILIGVLFAGLAVNEAFKGRSEERFLRLNLFADQKLQAEIVQRINYERTASGHVLASLFYNKGIEYFKLLRNSYLENFSLSYLFLHGDGNPRHNPAETGALYLIELPILVSAITLLFKEKRQKEFNFLLAWILIVPLATSLLLEQHGLRNSFLLPPLALLTAYGLSKVKRRWLAVIALVWLLQFVFVLEKMYFLAPKKHADFWSQLAFEAVFLSQRSQSNYDYIVISDEIDNIEFAYPVYTQVHPQEIISQYQQYPKKYGQVYLGEKQDLQGRILYLGVDEKGLTQDEVVH